MSRNLERRLRRLEQTTSGPMMHRIPVAHDQPIEEAIDAYVREHGPFGPGDRMLPMYELMTVGQWEAVYCTGAPIDCEATS